MASIRAKQLCARLGHEVISGAQFHSGRQGGKRLAVFLHGILGSQRNWRTPVRQIVSTFPSYDGLVVDHRAHGQSEAGAEPHDLSACADDLHYLFRELGREPDILCGHSFGGKVALAYSKRAIEQGWSVPRQTWVFDALPGSVDPHRAIGENSVMQIMNSLAEVPMPFQSRETLLSHLVESKKIPKAIASWLMTSLVRASDGKGVTWGFKLPVIQKLFEQYTQTCYYNYLEQLPAKYRIDFIRAGKNSAWTADVLQRFEGMKNRGNVKLHTLPNAGHWIHVDDPQGMVEIVTPSFQSLQ